jgi:CRP-like cAMP-binding protein
VQALEPTETLGLAQAQLTELRRAHPTIDKFVIDVLLADVRRVDTLLLEALYVPVEMRVLRRLIDLTTLYGRDRAADGTVEITLTQQDLASMAGTSRSTANRVLRELEEAGAVQLSRNRIRVLDEASLHKLNA